MPLRQSSLDAVIRTCSKWIVRNPVTLKVTFRWSRRVRICMLRRFKSFCMFKWILRIIRGQREWCSQSSFLSIQPRPNNFRKIKQRKQTSSIILMSTRPMVFAIINWLLMSGALSARERRPMIKHRMDAVLEVNTARRLKEMEWSSF